MSAMNFQQVMAHLIRFPAETLGAIQVKLGSPDLTPKEKQQLEKMAFDPLVRKFGHKMKYLRQVDATRSMRLSKSFIDEGVLDRLYQDLYEPAQETMDLETFHIHFLEFCCRNPGAQALLADAPPFVKDILEYEFARTEIEHEGPSENDPTLPPGSLLKHNTFKILDLNYDVPAADKLKIKDPNSAPVPAEKALKLIFLGIENAPYVRIFQIDEQVERFLTIQRTDPNSWQGELPQAYAPMVSVGLCRPTH